MSNPDRPTRRRLLLAGATAASAGLAGCTSFEEVREEVGVEVEEGSSEGTAGGSDTPAAAVDTPSGPRREFAADFDDGPGDWSGDVDALESIDDAARGAGAVFLPDEARRIELAIPETTVDTYSLWWRVPFEVTSVRFEFWDPAGALGFGAEVQTGNNGLEVVVNPETDSESGGASDLLSGTVQPGRWYKLSFESVDFAAGQFDAALADVGDSELIRMTQSFRSPIDTVAALGVRSRRGDAVAVDDVVVSDGG
ncbi:hypothetical protein [Halopenitus sp. POP-27]|uniref:hypothetical protein n=1 Tax=Halopenitus sp. POP-27 TaxID=2994425 RepID=UPI002468F9E8|nr:hypothetical protein [Halopenitus sp. POP-27]